MSVLNRLEELLRASFVESTSAWSRKDLVVALKLFSQAFSELKGAVLASLPFELAIVEFCEGTPEKNFSAKQNIGIPENIVEVPANIQTSTIGRSSSIDPSAQVVMAKWDEILENLKPFNHSLVGVLRSCRPVKLTDKALIIEANYKFHSERISEPKARENIAKIIKQVIGIEVAVRPVLKSS